MKIIIIDDDVIVRSSLKRIIENNEGFEVVGIGSDGEELIDLYTTLQPDVVLMDIRMKVMSGLEAGKILLQHYPDAKIIFLTTFSDDEYILDALEIGAKGYILKQDYEKIAHAINSVMNGQVVFGQEISRFITDYTHRKDHLKHDLTDAELQLIELVADGLNNKEISDKLGYSEGTIRNYLSNLLSKLNLRDRTQLAIYFYTQIIDNN